MLLILSCEKLRPEMLDILPGRPLFRQEAISYASPNGATVATVLPLAGREDLAAVHLVVPTHAFWTHLAKLREIGASGIVALPPDALLP